MIRIYASTASRIRWSGALPFDKQSSKHCESKWIQQHARCFLTTHQRSTPPPTTVTTDEGVIVHQADPSTSGDGLGLVWGSVLWPSGICLAKYLAWQRQPIQRVLELGCGTGVVGLTCAKLQLVQQQLTLTDSESSLWSILRKSLHSNGIDETKVRIHELDWRDPSTFLTLDKNPENQFDLIVAADVLYSGMDKLFARALASHLPAVAELSDNINYQQSQEPTVALVACPFRKDSPLSDFFGASLRLGLALERLEDASGSAVGAFSGVSGEEAFHGSVFVPLDSPERLRKASETPTFSDCNKKKVQIFRIRRAWGTAQNAIDIRRVSRI